MRHLSFIAMIICGLMAIYSNHIGDYANASFSIYFMVFNFIAYLMQCKVAEIKKKKKEKPQ